MGRWIWGANKIDDVILYWFQKKANGSIANYVRRVGPIWNSWMSITRPEVTDAVYRATKQRQLAPSLATCFYLLSSSLIPFFSARLDSFSYSWLSHYPTAILLGDTTSSAAPIKRYSKLPHKRPPPGLISHHVSFCATQHDGFPTRKSLRDGRPISWCDTHSGRQETLCQA